MASDESKAVLTRDDRVKQLVNIDRNVVQLLRSAGLAVKALASQPGESGADGSDMQSKKTAFTAATSQYFSLLSSVDVGLRRQIYALEEASIIPAEAAVKEVPSTSSSQNALRIPGAPEPKEKPVPEAGGMGSLDVGWLNSRNDKVGKEMEAELWEKVHSLLGALEAKENSGNDGRDASMSP